MNQSITQSHVSSLLDYWKHKDIVKSHLLQQSTDTLRMITVIGLVYMDLHIPFNKTENTKEFWQPAKGKPGLVLTSAREVSILQISTLFIALKLRILRLIILYRRQIWLF